MLAGQRQLVEAEARRYLAAQGIAGPITNPVQRLSEVAAEVDALRDHLQGRVRELSDEEFSSRTKLGAEQVSAVVSAYERALDRTVETLNAMAKLGIEERLVRITEVQALRLGECVDRALAGAGVTAEQRTKALGLLAEELAP